MLGLVNMTFFGQWDRARSCSMLVWSQGFRKHHAFQLYPCTKDVIHEKNMPLVVSKEDRSCDCLRVRQHGKESLGAAKLCGAVVSAWSPQCCWWVLSGLFLWQGLHYVFLPLLSTQVFLATSSMVLSHLISFGWTPLHLDLSELCCHFANKNPDQYIMNWKGTWFS